MSETIICPKCGGVMKKVDWRKKSCPECDIFMCEDCAFSDDYKEVAIEEALEIVGFVNHMAKKAGVSYESAKKIIKEIAEENYD